MLKVLILSLGMIFLQIPMNWEKYEEKNGLFSIQMPGEILDSEKLVETSTGDVLFNYIYHNSSVDSTENYLYLLNFHEVDKDLYALDSMTLNYEFLELMVEDIAVSIQADIIYTHKSHQGTFPAVEYRLSMEEGEKLIKGKILLSYDHLYNLQVYTISKYSLNKNIDHFINSFVLKVPQKL